MKCSCGNHDAVMGAGPLPSPSGIVCIGIAPGRDEVTRSKEPFTGPAGKMLYAGMKTAGYQIRTDTFVTNMCCHWKDEPTPEELAACFPRLLGEINAAKPRLIIGLGQIVNNALFNKQKRGHVVWSNTYNCWTMYTVHPSAIIRPDGEHFIHDFMRDLMKCKDILQWPDGEEQARINYRLLHTPLEAQAFLDNIPLDEPVAIDVETAYKTESAILCFTIAHSKDVGVFPNNVIQGLRWPDNVDWTMHGGMFDVTKIDELLGVKLTIREDTLLQSYSLDERGGQDKEEADNRPVGVHGLKTLAPEYLGVPDWNIHGIEQEWLRDDNSLLYTGTPSQQRVLEYNAKDAEYTRRLANVFIPKQHNDNVRDVYNELMIPATNALTEIRKHGVYIDQEAMRQLALEWIPQWLDMEQQLRDEAGGINLNSHPQLNTYVYDVLQLKPTLWGRSTRKEALELLPDVPWLTMLKKWRTIDHLVSTYITGIEDDIEADGRIHPDPILYGTRTGRLAYKNPPVATIPKHGEELSKIRKMFAANTPDKEIIEADYRQAELWVAYFCSQDKALLEALETGDFHGATAKEIFGIDETASDWDIKRSESKRGTFGIFYDISAKSLQRNHGHTTAYWEAFIKRWVTNYNDYWQWAEREKKKVINEGEQAARSGRKRRYWVVLNERTLKAAINMPIQASAHDHLLKSLIIIQLDKLLSEFGAYILFEVHDSLVIESPKAYRDEVIRVVRNVMQQPMFGFERGLMVDIKAGPNWYDLAEVKA